MKIRMFDLKGSVPFSQGYAIKAIAKAKGGRLMAAGEVEDAGNLYEAEENYGYIYVELMFKNGKVKLVYRDNGCELMCFAYQEEGKDWTRTVISQKEG